MAFGLSVHVVHELVDQGYGDLLHLTLGVGHLAHEDLPRVVDSLLGRAVQHAAYTPMRSNRRGLYGH